MSRLRKTVIPFRWNTITIAFTQGTAGSVNLASYLTNPEGRTITYSVVGTLPTGITLNGSTVSYNGTSPVASSSVQFRATSGAFNAESASTAVSISAATGNSPPVWVTPEVLSSLQSGQSFSITLAATDAESDPLSFSYGPPPFGSVVELNQTGGQRSLVWSGVAPTVTTDTSYTWTVTVDDTPPLGQVVNVSAVASSPTTVSLSWTAVTGASGYVVERSLTGSSDWSLVGSPVTTSLIVSGLTADTLYYFRVKATDGLREGNYSAAKSVRTQATFGTDWPIRSTAPGVVWAHDFRNEAEVSNFRRLPNDFAQASSTAPGGFSLNRNITVGVHDPILYVRQVQDAGTSSGYAIEITNLGSRLAADVNTTQMYIDLVDASFFPDPNDTPAQYYWVAIHADDDSDEARALWYPGETAGSKGIKECVTVRKKEGNRLWLAGRANSYGEYLAGGGIGPHQFLAGTPVGQDSDGGWNRPFSALTGEINGRGSDDVADGVTVRSDFVPVVQGQTYTQGLYGPAFYHTLFGPASKWDGEEFWMQWRVWFSPSRNDNLCPAGKQMWLDVYGIGSNQEWVTGGPGWRGLIAQEGGWQIDNRVRTYTNFGTSLAADQDYDWALGEWQTVMVRLRPGYAQDTACPFPGSSFEDESALTVDTSQFTPTNEVDVNDGIRKLTFETSLPQIYPYLPSASTPGPNGETTNRHDEAYWIGGGWQMTWPTGADWKSTVAPSTGTQFSGGLGLCIGAQVIDGRMRWTFKQRGVQSFTTGVPSHGHRMQMIPFDRTLATPPEYLIHEWDLWVKRDGMDPVQVYALRNYITPMGIPGVGKWSTYPPCDNGLQATGYGNVWDNLAPRASTTMTRWGDVIFSRSQIQWPA